MCGYKGNIQNVVRGYASLVKWCFQFLSKVYDYQLWIVDYVSSTRHNFLLLRWGLGSITELLVAAKVYVPLLHSKGYNLILVIVVHSWIELFSSLLWMLANYVLMP